jgi:hypothetical protein
MSPLSIGEPSKCCVSCWDIFTALRESYQPRFLKKWHGDRWREEKAGCFDPEADKKEVHATVLKLKAKAPPF